MIRRLAFLFLVAVIGTGCGSKKKIAAKRKSSTTQTIVQSKPSEGSNTAHDSDYLLPVDTGKFVKFPIASVEEYIETFAEIAQFEMKAYGIPASITLAQGILESGAGRSNLVQRTNNHFGIKCHTGWNGDFDYHDDDEKGECFRKYNHPMYSFRDHSEFLSSRARYAFLFDLASDDYHGWAKGLSKAGYATDKRYPQKLISFIEQYKLDRYDAHILSKGTVVQKVPKEFDFTTHTVQKGDTLYSLSRRYYVSVEELMKLNKMKDTGLSIGQELIVKTIKSK
ncbi:glucosaminidase domain-containing protein [Arenibacter sp. GZD96]|uniref:glucosaminidase domain-containing protein n=1 Tax=Aurantibrevibacter litoralis TaxID=3106030 RepID=UPI002AFF09BF|nr:glucosaminidase domain-containing protein [Arenibacter sp. GZD-96]MEA1785789.1 glucosaminidase domain-containing protein [Arenibacter sp. GZD-96]